MHHREQLVIIQHSQKPELTTLKNSCVTLSPSSDVGEMSEELNLFVLRAARSAALQDGSIVNHLLYRLCDEDSGVTLLGYSMCSET